MKYDNKEISHQSFDTFICFIAISLITLIDYFGFNHSTQCYKDLLHKLLYLYVLYQCLPYMTVVNAEAIELPSASPHGG